MKTVKQNEQGQVIMEYVIMLGMFIAVSMTLLLLLSVFSEYGWRIYSLVGLEYP